MGANQEQSGDLTEQTAPDPQHIEVDPSQLKLLVVDNEAAHARAMTESLEKVGYGCEVATSGPEAASQTARRRPTP